MDKHHSLKQTPLPQHGEVDKENFGHSETGNDDGHQKTGQQKVTDETKTILLHYRLRIGRITHHSGPPQHTAGKHIPGFLYIVVYTYFIIKEFLEG